jgi:hypothetical protein
MAGARKKSTKGQPAFQKAVERAVRLKRPMKGVIALESDEKNLIALLDAGNVQEFRRRLEQERQQRRQEMFAQVLGL